MTACQACRSDFSTTAIAAPKDFEYFVERAVPTEVRQCSTCGSLFQHPWPDKAEALAFYPADYQNYERPDVPLLSKLLSMAQRRAAQTFVRQVGQDARMLDFGCGDGSFLGYLAAEGMTDLVGYEPNLRETERETRPKVTRVGSLRELRDAGRTFDVIRMHHVIEHLTELDSTMQGLRHLLSPNGVILVQTPNVATATWRLFGQNWGPLHYPYHTVLFTPQGMEAGSQRWGLKIEATTNTPMPTGWAMSLENLIKRSLGSRRRGRLRVYGLLVAAALPMSYAEAAIRPSKAAVLDYTLSAG
ncbi:class I SAM-dependent methyltransferase [Algihabitans albus]|uniref:class I SAM-dependent methyltransferase n=1 Tax=Algihabitans albus TaxID=2164067 RepID=UPI000E5C71D7|nr:class I SAM-dependent methyltransferase [Algihabitans albus]